MPLEEQSLHKGMLLHYAFRKDFRFGDDDDEVEEVEEENLPFPAKLLAGGQRLPVCRTKVGRLHRARWSAGWMIIMKYFKWHPVH